MSKMEHQTRGGGVMTPEECVRMGGHCYFEDRRPEVLGRRTVYHRMCKHCGNVQVGYTQDSIEWKQLDNVVLGVTEVK